jgi:radical SAM superfamily enzyme YgiQ (UPF0313 family)
MIKQVSSAIRQEAPKAFQVLGGIHATLQPEALMDVSSLDALCRGYGEGPLLDLVTKMENAEDIDKIQNMWLREREDRDIVKNDLRPFPRFLDDFFPYDYGIFYEELVQFADFHLENSRIEVIFCRGCPFNCTFCCNQAVKALAKKAGGSFLAWPSVEVAIKEIKILIGMLGPRTVEIHDDTITVNKAWFNEFMLRYAEEIHLPFWCNVRAGLKEEEVRLLKKAGCVKAFVGIESGNDYIRNVVLNKKLGRRAIVESFHMLHSYGIGTVAQNMIGIPGENPKMFMDTIRINADVQPSNHILSIFYPYPGTTLYNVSKEQNLIDETKEQVIERLDSVLQLPKFPPKDMRFFFNNFDGLVRYEYLRNKAKLLLMVPLTDKTARLVVWLSKIFNVMRCFGGLSKRILVRVAQVSASVRN